MNKIDALHSLRPNAEWVLRGEELEWLDTNQTQPTEAEIQAEVQRLQAEYNANQFQRDRAADYPPVEEQLDYIYHNGLEAWKTDIINPIKTKHPKT